MKKICELKLHILFWLAIPLVTVYFKWAAQKTNSLPGIPPENISSFLEICYTSFDIIIVSLLGSLPIFYWIYFHITPKILIRSNTKNIVLLIASLVLYFFVISFLAIIIFPMYYFFGIPYAIKVLAPIILISITLGALLNNKETINKLS